MGKIEIIGTILVFSFLYLSLSLITAYSGFEGKFVPFRETKEQLSSLTWTWRITDTITQAFILFSALVGVISVWSHPG